MEGGIKQGRWARKPWMSNWVGWEKDWVAEFMKSSGRISREAIEMKVQNQQPESSADEEEEKMLMMMKMKKKIGRAHV